MNLKNLLIVSLLLCSSLFVQAQNIEVSPIVGYQFGMKAKSIYRPSTNQFGDLRIVPDMNYGAALGVKLPLKGVRLEFMWTRQDSEITYKPYNSFETENLGDIAVEYFMLSGWKELEMDQLGPFAGFTIGGVNFAPQAVGSQQAFKMAVGLGGGIKYFFTENVGIRAQVRMLVPVEWFGLGFTIGTGGSGAGATVSSTIISGDVGGGLVFRFGGE